MLTDSELKAKEQKYLLILKDVFSKNIAKILNESYSQNMQQFITYGTANPIEHAIENIIEKIVAENLDWPICSVPISSDSCYECGDAIVYLDAKTIIDTDGDATGDKVTVQAAQTSYDSATTLIIPGITNTWKANVPHYANHKVFGEVPNLTFIIKFIYLINIKGEYLIKKIQLISIPNGQLFSIFTNNILCAGRSVSSHIYTNIRFKIDKIKAIENWRVIDIFDRS